MFPNSFHNIVVFFRYEDDMQSTTERELARLRLFVQQQYRDLLEQGDNEIRRANFDDETTRRLEAFRLGSADVQRQRQLKEDEYSLLKSIRSAFVTVVRPFWLIHCLFLFSFFPSFASDVNQIIKIK
jgi:hypothetical protein